MQDVDAHLIYSKGKLAGSCLLLETILQIPRFQWLQRSQVIVGPFQMEELLELPESWPECREVETTISAAVIDVYKRQNLISDFLTGVHATHTQINSSAATCQPLCAG